MSSIKVATLTNVFVQLHSRVIGRASEISIGCSVEVEGRLMESCHPGQTVEMKADTIRLIGPCDSHVSS